jgi:hypothetical protein
MTEGTVQDNIKMVVGEMNGMIRAGHGNDKKFIQNFDPKT